MKCYIVNDLLPEYIENLCSEETKKEIETHIAGCKKCQQSLKNMKPEDEDKTTLNFNPFQKIQKKIKIQKRIKVLLIAVLAVLAAFFVYMGIAQACPYLNLPINYDKIVYNYKAKQIAKDIINGKTDALLAGVNNTVDSISYIPIDIYYSSEVFYNDTNDKLSELYAAGLSDENYSIKSDVIDYDCINFYSNKDSIEFNSKHGMYYAYVTIQSATQNIPLMIEFFNQDSYIIYLNSYDTQNYLQVNDSTAAFFETYNFYVDTVIDTDIDSFATAISMEPGRVIANTPIYRTFSLLCANFPADCRLPIAEASLTSEEIERLYDYNSTGKWTYDEIVRCTERSNQMEDEITAIYTNSETIGLNIKNTGYNEDVKVMNATMYWEIKDTDGNYGIMIKYFYHGPYGYEAVDDNEFFYCDDNFDPELKKMMEEVFDK